MKVPRHFSVRSSQRGVVLLFCLIFMTSMTLLGLSATSDTITQTQLASNLRDAALARQSAKLSLAWAEQWLKDFNGPAPQSCSSQCSGFYAHPANTLGYDLPVQSLAWWVARGFAVGLDPVTGANLSATASSGADPAIWIVQKLHHSPASSDGSVPPLDWYRILVRTTGSNPNTVSVLESIVSKDWSNSSATPWSTRVSWQELR